MKDGRIVGQGTHAQLLQSNNVYARQRQIGNREKGNDLDEHEAAKAVNVVVFDSEKSLGDDSLPAEKEDDRQRQNKRRGDDRKMNERIEEAAAGHLRARAGVCEQIAHQRGEERRNRGQLQAVGENRAIAA